MKEQRSDQVAGLFSNEGILSEILSWLEVKHVLRFKLVCKFWYAIVNNKQFVDMHMSHNGRLSFHYLDTQSINSDETKENIMYLDRYCKGLLLGKKSSDSEKPTAIYQISNPSTKFILDLPDLHNRARHMSIFHDSSTNSYYVFSICQENKKRSFKILDLGGQSNDPYPNANLCWKTFTISEYEELYRQQRYQFSCVLSKGILYIIYLLEVGLSKPKIICFDLVKQQTSRTLDMPDQNLCLNWRKVCFQLWRGKPSVTFVLEEKLNVWGLEDYKNQKWADMIQISLSFLREDPSFKEVVMPYIYCDDNGEDFLLYKTKKFDIEGYNPESKNKCMFPSSYSRVPATLVSVKGMRPE